MTRCAGAPAGISSSSARSAASDDLPQLADGELVGGALIYIERADAITAARPKHRIPCPRCPCLSRPKGPELIESRRPLIPKNDPVCTANAGTLQRCRKCLALRREAEQVPARLGARLSRAWWKPQPRRSRNSQSAGLLSHLIGAPAHVAALRASLGWAGVRLGRWLFVCHEIRRSSRQSCREGRDRSGLTPRSATATRAR